MTDTMIAAAAGLLGALIGAGVTVTAAHLQLRAASHAADAARRELRRAEVRTLLSELLLRGSRWMVFAAFQTQVDWSTFPGLPNSVAHETGLKTVEDATADLRELQPLVIELLLVVRDEHLRTQIVKLDAFFRSPEGVGLAARAAFSSFQSPPSIEVMAGDLEAVKTFGQLLQEIEARAHALLVADL